MSLEVIIGIGVVAFLALFMVFKLRDSPTESLQGNTRTKHFILQFIFVFVFLFCLLFLANGIQKADTNHCELVNTVNTSATPSYSYECYNTGSTNGTGFYNMAVWTVGLVFAYIFFYFIYEVLKFIGWVVPK